MIAPPLIPLLLLRDYPYRNNTGEVLSEILQAPIHGAGWRRWKGCCFTSVHWKQWKTKSITARGKAGRTACHVVCSFPCKKASQLSVRPFLRSVNLCIQNAVGQGS